MISIIVCDRNNTDSHEFSVLEYHGGDHADKTAC